jgi:hypothetical protein
MSNLLINEIKNSSSGKMNELSKEEQAMTLGGAECTYASLTYSPGSVISKPGGGTLTCGNNGSWF